jgi:transposase
MNLYPKTINGRKYYYAQRSVRVKIDSKASGKAKGSGKSRVRSETIYLGTAEAIVKKIKEMRTPLEARHREFGFVAAVYRTAEEIGLVDLLKAHIPGRRHGLPRWLYFILPIINRLEHATSKEKMGTWAGRTVLPDLLGFDPKRLNSKSFWYATDDVISEKELSERREENPGLEDELFVGLDDEVFRTIEKKLVANLQEQYRLDGHSFLYDTTNFFTYIEPPVRAKLPQAGHNKASRHHLRQVGLALCVDKQWGIPLFHRIYRGNSQDSKTFAALIDELAGAMRTGFKSVENLVLILDKGNNSKENFARLKGKLEWVGSLVPSQYADLYGRPLDAFEGQWEQHRYHRCKREVMGIQCTLVLTYSDKLARKQKHTLRNGIEKLERQIREKWASYKRAPKSVPAGIETLRKNSRYKDCIAVTCQDRQPHFEQTGELAIKEKHLGRNLLFSSDLDAQAQWVITQYHAKDRIEDDFKLLKLPELIRWSPCRHWTDTKIRAFGFCAIMALAVIRVMELKAHQAGIDMSPILIKEELCDLKELTMVYDLDTVETQISHRSSVQQRLWDLFDLCTAENQLTGH